MEITIKETRGLNPFVFAPVSFLVACALMFGIYVIATVNVITVEYALHNAKTFDVTGELNELVNFSDIM